MIILKTSADVEYKFRVIFGEGYAPMRRKAGVQRRTVTGKMDNQVAPVEREWRYTLKVYASETVQDYGDLDDLKALFGLNDPPHNILTLTDAEGEVHEVYFIGDLAETPMVPVLGDAWYRVPVTFVGAT